MGVDHYLRKGLKIKGVVIFCDWIKKENVDFDSVKKLILIEKKIIGLRFKGQSENQLIF